MPRKKKPEVEKTESIAKKKTEKPEKIVKKIKKKTVKEEMEKSIKITKKELEEKAKKLAEKIEEGDLKERLEEAREEEKIRKKTLVTIDEYVKVGVHIGTKVITPHMRSYVYRRRNDGIAIINTNIIDERLKEAAKFLADYNPSNVIIVCKRESGWRAVKLFSELTGIKCFTKKYPAGIITNTALPDFFETELVVICDPWIDKNALSDAVKMKKKVLGLCDTNNFTFGVDKIVPCNNKSNKSLGVIFYILAREYMKIQRINKPLPPMKDFIGEELEDFIKEKKEDKAKAEELEEAKSKVEKLLSFNDEED